MQQRKIPLRKCSGCGIMKPKKELVRIVKTPDNDVLLDLSGKINGRGAYICRSSECLIKAKKAKRIERSLSCKISEELYSAMETELKTNE